MSDQQPMRWQPLREVLGCSILPPQGSKVKKYSGDRWERPRSGDLRSTFLPYQKMWVGRLHSNLNALCFLRLHKDCVPVRMQEREWTALCFSSRTEPSDEILKLFCDYFTFVFVTCRSYIFYLDTGWEAAIYILASEFNLRHPRCFIERLPCSWDWHLSLVVASLSSGAVMGTWMSSWDTVTPVWRYFLLWAFLPITPEGLGSRLTSQGPAAEMWASPLTNTQPVNCQNMFIIFLWPGRAWRWGNSIPMQQKHYILLLKLFLKMPWIAYPVTHSGLETKAPESGRLGISVQSGEGQDMAVFRGARRVPQKKLQNQILQGPFSPPVL